MPGDISRKTFNPTKHYSAVLKQQGRVNTDADDNEQVAIWHHRTHTEATDVIGRCGVPIAEGGFAIGLTSDGHDLTISAGRIYVDGLLFETEASSVPIEFVANNVNQAIVPTTILDGQPLDPGQWVEVSAAGIAQPRLFQITLVDETNRVLTLSDSMAVFQAGTSPVLRRAVTYITQPDNPSPEFTASVSSPPSLFETLSLADGTYIVYLEGSQREITALDDRLIREVALGGPDTGTRLKNTWQVRILRVTPSGAAGPTCETSFSEWNLETARPTGTLNVRTQFTAESENLCLLPPTSGFSRLENQLYRVEIHSGGDRDSARFKWSRDNATVETTINQISGKIVSVADTGKDEFLGFAADQWVEIVDGESALNDAPSALVQIDSVDPNRQEITMKTALPALTGRLKLRRWDQSGASATANGVAMSADWINLEGNIQVLFSVGTYRPGDYWVIPARTATGEVEWPPFEIPNSRPIAQHPAGIKRHYCRLALVTSANGAITAIRDCRRPFPPLTEVPGPEPGIHVVRVSARNVQGQVSILGNDTNVLGANLLGGIVVECDTEIDAASVSRPTCFVTMELPFDRSSLSTAGGVESYVSLSLTATVASSSRNITWLPSPRASALLSNLPILPEGERGFLTRLILKGNFIWAASDPTLYLDGDAFGFRELQAPVTSLRLPSGDRRRGGDFEMWFWLIRPAPVTVFSINVNVTAPPVLRGEGVTELVADIILTGTGGAPTAAGSPVPQFNIQVFANATITSPAIGNGFEDVVMLVDDPVRLNTGATVPTSPPVVGVGPAGLDYRNGVAPNIFLGRRVQANAIVFQAVPIDPPTTGQTRTFRIKNLRLNASQLTVGPTGVSTATVLISLTGASSVPVTNSQQNVGFINAGATTRVARADGLSGVFSFNPSQGINIELATLGQSQNAQTNINLDFTEAFASAFKLRKEGSVSPFTTRLMEEAGFDNQGSGALPIQSGPPLPQIGAVLCGTRLQATFRNVPSGLRIFVTTRDVPIPGASAQVRAVIVPDPNAPLPSEVPPTTGSQTGGISILEIPIVAGTANVLWEWVNRTPGSEFSLQSLRFGIVLAARQGGVPPTGQTATIQLALAPPSTNPNPTGVPIPRFVSTGTPQPGFIVIG